MSIFLSSCFKDSNHLVVGDYSSQSEALGLVDNRTFSAVLTVNLNELELPDNSNEYDILLEVISFYEVNLDQKYPRDTIYYELGSYQNSNVSIIDTVSVASDGRFTHYKANLIVTKENKRIRYTIDELEWKCWGGVEESNSSTSTNQTFRGFPIFPDVYFLTKNYIAVSNNETHSNVLNGQAVSYPPPVIANLNAKGVLYDDYLGTIYNDVNDKVKYFHKQNSQVSLIGNLSDFRCAIRVGQNFYILRNDQQLRIYDINTQVQTFVKNVDFNNLPGLIWPHNNANASGNLFTHYDLILHNGKTYLYRKLPTEIAVYVFNENTISWDILPNNYILDSIMMEYAVFVRSDNELYICSDGEYEINVYKIESSNSLMYKGDIDKGGLYNIVRCPDADNVNQTYSLTNGLIKF